MKQERLKSFVTTLRRTAASSNEGPAGAFPQESVHRLLESTPFAKSDSEKQQVADIHKRLLADQPIAPRERRLYEAIILPTERPPLLIQNSTFGQPPQPWTELDAAPFRPNIERAIPSVGRLELFGDSSVPFAGTGFVVGPGLIMTNRHVAHIFGEGRGKSVRFIDGLGSAIDFRKEDGSRLTDTHKVAKIVMIHPYWDMALLHVEGLATPALQLDPVHPDDHKGRRIVVIGYPFEDERNPLDLQYRIFDGKFGVKRLQPGYGRGVLQHTNSEGTFEVFGHDASTLGGNSGSAVVDPATGKVVALHFAGEYEESNYAVPAFELGRDAHVRDAGVSFSSGAAAAPNPWQPDWDGTEAVRRSTGAAAVVSDGVSSSVLASVGSQAISIPIEIQIRVGTPS